MPPATPSSCIHLLLSRPRLRYHPHTDANARSASSSCDLVLYASHEFLSSAHDRPSTKSQRPRVVLNSVGVLLVLNSVLNADLCSAHGVDLIVKAPAGRSFRMLDVSDIPPSFSADPMRSIALFTSGDVALRTARLSMEDSRTAGTWGPRDERLK
ncbi:hypothetical protein B0H11DRAFT_2245906 [Mycena galericulata]|nr:hypothetical protein B0H11DRAFT_2245906 [Mycena galericulata]